MTIARQDRKDMLKAAAFLAVAIGLIVLLKLMLGY